MSGTTPNIGLATPSMTDAPSQTIPQLAQNFQTIDNQFGSLSKKVDYNKMQAKYTANFLKKLGQKQPFKIVCQGDSLTYGEDLYSTDKRTAMSDPTMDTTYTSTVTQAGKTYPEALLQNLQNVYGSSNVTILNRGIPGSWAAHSLSHWTTNPNADLHLLMLGTNDATTNPSDGTGQDIQAYITNMSALIEQIIDFGSAVVLLMSPRQSQGAGIWLETYREALHGLGKKYGIPVIPVDDFMKGYTFLEVASDDPGTQLDPDDSTHFNTLGYSIIGSKLAGLFVGVKNLLEPYKVTNNAILSIEGDGIGYITNGWIGGDNNSPLGMWSSQLGAKANLSPGQQYTFSFYTEDENLLLIPVFSTGGSTAQAQVQLDFGITQPYLESSFLINQANRGSITRPPATYTFNAGFNMDYTAYTALKLSDIGSKVIHLPAKGSHAVTVSNVGTTYDLYLYGFIVYGWKEFNQEKGVNVSDMLGYKTSNPANSSYYALIGSIILSNTGVGASLTLNVKCVNRGYKDKAILSIATRYNTAGTNPDIDCIIHSNEVLLKNNFILNTTLNGSTAQIDIYLQNSAAFIGYGFNADFEIVSDSNNASIKFYDNTAWISAIPTGGTQSNPRVLVSTYVSVPSTATSTGNTGEYTSDGSYLYICTGTNTWKRVAVATF